MNRSVLPLVCGRHGRTGRADAVLGEQLDQAPRVGAGHGVVSHHSLDPDTLASEEASA